MAEFFTFYLDGVLKILNWFTEPIHLFGLFVFGFFVVSFLGFWASLACCSGPDDVRPTVWGILFVISFVVFCVLGVPFLIFLSQ